MLDRLIDEIPRFFNYYTILFILEGMSRTLAMTVLGCGIGFLLGFGLTYLRRSTAPWLVPGRMLAFAYVEIFRRIPFLVILFIVMFAIQVFSAEMSLFAIAVIAICVIASAFLAEIVRAGFDAVPRQQTEAAEVMNFSRWQTVRYVTLPQSWRVILPPAVAFAVMFIKDTSLASHVSVIELTYVGKILNNRGFSPILVFGTVLSGYFALSYPLSRLGMFLEAKLAPSPFPARGSHRRAKAQHDLTMAAARGPVSSPNAPARTATGHGRSFGR